MNEFLPLVFPLMIGLIVLVSLGEMAISSMWLPAYYQYAIPLFRKEYPLLTMPDLTAQIPELEQKLKRSAWRPSIVFRALNENEIAFRNNFGSRNAMSGLVRLEPNQGRMRISGHLYWTFFLTPLLFLVMMFMFPISAFFLLFILAMFVMTFGMQRHQYGKIAAVIAETAVSTSSLQSASTGSMQSVFTSSKIDTNPELTWKEPIQPFQQPLETVSYKPEYDPFTTEKPKSGLNNTEIILLGLFLALIVIGGVLGFLILSG